MLKAKRGNSKKDEKKKVYVFSFASFFNDFGANMIYPIWPIFLTTVLGANMSILGLVDGLGDALVSISQALSGYASDRLRKRKIFIWFGYLLAATSRLGYAVTTSWPMVIPFKILDRSGKIRASPRDAIVAEESTLKNRGSNFGLLKGMDKLGGVFGILFCIFFINYFGYQTFFVIAAIPSIISAALVYFVIKEKRDISIRLYKGIQLTNLTHNYRLFLALSAIFALGTFSYSFLLVFANKFGFSIAFIPILYLIYIVFTAAFSLPFGKLSDKIGRKKLMYIAMLLWGLTCLVCIISNTWWAIMFTFVLYGLHQAALDPVQTSYVSELAPKKFRASAMGGFQMVIGLCALPASVVAGLLWDNISPAAPFVLSLGLTLVAMIMLHFVKETEKVN